MKPFRIFFVLIVFGLSLYFLLTKPLYLGLDLQGGVRVVLEVQDAPDKSVDEDAVLGVIEVIRSRVDALGVAEPVIQRKGFKQVIVELPGVSDAKRAIDLIGERAVLTFRQAEWAPFEIEKLSKEKQALLAGEGAELSYVFSYDDMGRVSRKVPIFLKELVLRGSDLKGSYPGTNQYGQPAVDIEFTTEGAKRFYEVTAENVGKPLAILLDGKVISAPNVNQAIAGGRAQIEGGFTVAEMRDLVIQLKAGALPLPVELLSDRIVGPSLGIDSINKSWIAFYVGVGLLMLYMIGAYRIMGLLACLCLGYYLVLVLAVFKLLEATLTLPGIAGLILTLGMAVDANIIIFERIKEELHKGLAISVAIREGFSKAFVAILDANVTTLVAAMVLFFVGVGSIKGFAVFLSIGILSSMFTAIVVCKLCVETYFKLVPLKTLEQKKS